ncbi:YjbF family lipoprotein [Paracoccus sp. 1_MG-2023]|uniref:YjbF family lipoprotein n=1 Tax=unclassified Paracoccus (in: a-proteobacteria) TaxID=2688777 RepID=UPI001C09A601|nr:MULTISPECIES: YjbF family lipoprotein [unclassified Paracoccus (in: a-proteobacteria)]MBU2958082.1 YjbF family lipoprotein [Paracoccus sp. C2R09]MDO6669332.1 YjbF family lipoprotein [Paracoccus sp. 1_MG-2023]
MIGSVKLTMALGALAALAACGNDTAATGPLGVLAQTAGQVVADRRAEPAAPAPTPAQAAAEALRVNQGPLIQAGFEGLGRTQVMAMTGQNGAMRTYMTPSEEALIIRDGLLIGTRGLGNDLSVAEIGTAAAIRAGAGSGTRVMRYYSGDGLERPLEFDCTVGAGPKPGVTVENCEGHGVSFQNSYAGQGAVSRQWIGPAAGYVTIQTLRP